MKTQETLTLAGKSMHVDVYSATVLPPKGAVVVGYGTEGMNAPFDALIDRFCKAASSAGYLTVLPYFFEGTNTAPATKTVTADLGLSGTWIDILAAASSWAQAKAGGGKSAFVGFSLGANQILNAALKSAVVAAVDYFGPIDRFGFGPMPAVALLTNARVKKLPPTLIHHGKKDLIVPPSQSALLSGWLNGHGVACTYWNDYDNGHPGQRDDDWTGPAQKTSEARTISFLKNYI